MERKYKRLFDLTVKHDYYTSGLANDFVFSPTSQTNRDLSRYKLTARLKSSVPGHTEAYGLTVSYTEVDGAPLIPITLTDRPSLVFGLNLKNTKFLNFTTQSQIPPFKESKVLYFTNPGGAVPAVLSLGPGPAPVPVILRRKVFEFKFTLTDPNKNKATLQILDAAGLEIPKYTQLLENSTGIYEALIDLNGLDDGIYSVRVLKTEAPVPVVSTTKYYISDELTAMNPMAIIDIRPDSNAHLSGVKLELNFLRRSVLWKYWVIYLNPSAVPGEITITKSGMTIEEDLPPLGFPEDTNTKIALEAQYPAPAAVRLFVSDTTVPLTEEPIKEIKLKRDAATLVNNLPGMPVDSAKTEAYIFI